MVWCRVARADTEPADQGDYLTDEQLLFRPTFESLARFHRLHRNPDTGPAAPAVLQWSDTGLRFGRGRFAWLCGPKARLAGLPGNAWTWQVLAPGGASASVVRRQ